jgi:TetR/AcrR family transcriptional repressor of lmrAB and yxaGH operons
MRSSDAKQRMLQSAVRLFRQQGYRQTSMLEVVRDSGAPRGSLYHHFPGGKQDMARQAVELASAAVLAWIRAAAERSGSGAELVRRLGDAYRGAMRASDFAEGCPLATVALETAPGVPEVAAACHAGFQSWVEAIAAALRGFGHPPERAEALALHAVSAIEGALLLSRAAGSDAPLESVVAQLEAAMADA